MIRNLLLSFLLFFTLFSYGQTQTEPILNAYELIYVNNKEYGKQLFMSNVNLYYSDEGNFFQLDGYNSNGEKKEIIFKYSYTENGKDYFNFFNSDYEFLNDEEKGIFIFKSLPKPVKNSNDTMYREFHIKAI